MDYLKISNWDKWQTYRKDRGQPPWIKIHRRLMRNPEWVSLSDTQRGQLVSMWLLAADHDGVIPASTKLIEKLCYMSDKINLNIFIDLGFIDQNGCQYDAGMTSLSRQDVTPKAEAEAEAEKNKSKEKKKFSPPTLEEVKAYFEEKQFPEQLALKAFEYYNTANWHDARGHPVKNWKQKVLAVWMKEENRIDKGNETNPTHQNVIICRSCKKPVISVMDGLCRDCKGY